jgi:hypothetical protein
VTAGLSQHSSIFRLFAPQVQHVLIKEVHKRDLRETLRVSAELTLNECRHAIFACKPIGAPEIQRESHMRAIMNIPMGRATHRNDATGPEWLKQPARRMGC